MVAGLRIIAGQFGGRRLHSPPGNIARPSGARLREALFSILQAKGMVEGVKVLDVCAGSGALGLEALSQGAQFCVFVEKDHKIAAVLKRNIEMLDIGGRAQIYNREFSSFGGGSFELILADPPYNQGIAHAILPWVKERDLLAPGGMVIIEHSLREQPAMSESFAMADQRRYGQSILSFFIKQKF